MTKVQERLLEMLSYFHKLCEKNELRYYLLYGTALGAARHEGFIPWDDDIDVGMPRGDYEALKKVVAAENLGRFCFEYPGCAIDYAYPYGKMYDTGTTLIENTRYRTKRGIFIDIFPLDGAGDAYEESLAGIKPIQKRINMLLTKRCVWRRERKFYKNMGIVLLRHYPFISAKRLMNEIDSMCRKQDFDECVYVAALVGGGGKQEIIKREWLGNPTLCKFENNEFYGPQKPDEYLSALYGDWRKLPPKEEQKSNHDYLEINLDESYI